MERGQWFLEVSDLTLPLWEFLQNHLPPNETLPGKGSLAQLVDKPGNPYLAFTVNRTLRLFLNDLFILLLLAGWFQSRSVLRLAFAIQLINFFILLPPYLLVKLNLEGDTEISSPLLSQFHRLIVNPTLMILLLFLPYISTVYKEGMSKRIYLSPHTSVGRS